MPLKGNHLYPRDRNKSPHRLAPVPNIWAPAYGRKLGRQIQESAGDRRPISPRDLHFVCFRPRARPICAVFPRFFDAFALIRLVRVQRYHFFRFLWTFTEIDKNVIWETLQTGKNTVYVPL